jgi:hypothetical protein
MSVKYFIKAKTSEYTDKEGASKSRYSTIGTVVETRKGDLMMKLEMIPLLGLKEGTLWAYLNVPEDKAPGSPAKDVSNLDEDIPF